jgi:hypothetical protein
VARAYRRPAFVAGSKPKKSKQTAEKPAAKAKKESPENTNDALGIEESK